MASIQYFAYGSNMLSERLRARCKSAAVRFGAFVEGYELAFSKKSQDGSGKATILPSSAKDCRVHGVVFDFDDHDLQELDRYEGLGNGYGRISDFSVQMVGSREPLKVVTYIADSTSIDQSLKPYDWYLNLVVAGARQHALPSDYIAAIEAVQSVRDPQDCRPSRREALKLLEALTS